MMHFYQDEDELNNIHRKLKDSKTLNAEDLQELWYRKNYLESVKAFGEDNYDYGDDQ